MRRIGTGALAALMVWTLVGPVTVDAEEPQPDGYVTESIRVPTRDGGQLRGAVSFPTLGGTRLPGPFPVVLEYTPYCNPGAQPLWTSHGFVYASVHLPGACGSDGQFTVYTPPVGRAGYDAVEWLGTQPWSTGKVGMVGASAPGIAQLHTAREHPPHLTTIAPSIASLDFYNDIVYPGGILNSADSPVLAGIIASVMITPGIGYRLDNPESARRMIESGEGVPEDIFTGALTHTLKDDFWTIREVDPAAIDIPVFALGNWDDFAPRTAVRLFTETAHPSNRLAIGGVGHNGTPLPDYDGDAETVAWMDYWLKSLDNGMAEQLASGPIEYYVLGGGEWRTAAQWPPSPETVTL
ncbi:MAG: CocE/NonD family hydrolase, partial [Nocardioidaceae bacterium]